MSLAIDVDLTKFDKIIAEGYDFLGGADQVRVPEADVQHLSADALPEGGLRHLRHHHRRQPLRAVGDLPGMTYAGSFDGSWPRSGGEGDEAVHVRGLHVVRCTRWSRSVATTTLPEEHGRRCTADEHGRSACLIGAVLDRLDPAMLNSLPGLQRVADMVIGCALEAGSHRRTGGGSPTPHARRRSFRTTTCRGARPSRSSTSPIGSPRRPWLTTSPTPSL